MYIKNNKPANFKNFIVSIDKFEELEDSGLEVRPCSENELKDDKGE